MKQRIITVLWGIPLLIAIVLCPYSQVFASLIVVVVLLGIVEFYQMAAQRGEQPFNFFGFLFAPLFVVNAYFGYKYTIYLLPAALIIPSLWFVLRLILHRREATSINLAWTLAGMLYIGWMLSYYVALREIDPGRGWVLFALFSTFACDSAAFFVGRAWGRHPLAPAISPGKTMEGTIAGLVASPAAALILYFTLKITGLPLPLSYPQAALLGFLIGIFAQLGDLVESRLKRRAGVKDSGSLIPGHGGVLDRIDSIVFTGVIVYYYYTVWVIG